MWRIGWNGCFISFRLIITCVDQSATVKTKRHDLSTEKWERNKAVDLDAISTICDKTGEELHIQYYKYCTPYASTASLETPCIVHKAYSESTRSKVIFIYFVSRFSLLPQKMNVITVRTISGAQTAVFDVAKW